MHLYFFKRISGNRDVITRVHGIGSDLYSHHDKTINYWTYLSDGETRGILPPAHLAKASLVLDDAVWDSHLPAQSWQKHHQLKIKYF